MKCYRVWYSNSAAVLVDAMSEEVARQIAEERAATDGYPGLSVSQIECLSD